MDSSALPEVMMGSTFTLCCTATPPLSLCLESTLDPTGRLLLTCAHGHVGTGLLPPPATTEGKFPTLPSPRGACPHPASSWSPSAPHVLVGVPWGHGHWVHTSLCPSGQARRQEHIHTLEAGVEAGLCHGIVPALLCLWTLGQKAEWLGCCLGS